MLPLSAFKGVIFDVDDTILDNYPDNTEFGLHDRSRLMAAHIVGKRISSRGLQNLTQQHAIDAFLQAKAHTLHDAIWEMLRMAGEVSSEIVQKEHIIVKEIASLKEKLHEDILRAHAREVPGAMGFIRSLAQNGLQNHLAIASTSNKRDIDIFLNMSGVKKLFPEPRIVSRESVVNHKPHPESYIKAFGSLGLLNVPRNEVLAFEDDPRGIASAKSAGLFVCAITTRLTSYELNKLVHKPDLIASSFKEFSFLLNIPAEQAA